MTQTKKICIHGHFYQPPRIDPWFGELLPEGSAAPGVNWNQRILEASYAPMAWARRRDGQGLITEIVNCYAWISFNLGPTLLSWLEGADPACYARILEADRQSLRRWGHGNAMAQCHHHMIMPLASPLDKEVQLTWAKADFYARFQRDPEGLWLPEAAVDTATLKAVADVGFRFVILAPRQAAAVADLDGSNCFDVNASNLDIFSPYAVFLPSGRSLAVFFYHGPLSHAVAFERLLENGEQFWQRLTKAAEPGLLSLATDGETYGHHFPFGEMALAYVLEQAKQGRDGLELTNFAAYLAENPPNKQVFLREPSSWSCVHGVERWRADCGCTDGGHPGWNQRWRVPLRQALESNKSRIDTHFFAAGKSYFKDARATLLDYGRLLAGGAKTQGFVDEHFLSGLSKAARQQGFDLLAMQDWAMCSLASCAWFFDEISRVEPLNAMTYALRAMELARATGAADLTEVFLQTMAQADSNLPDKGNGADLWHSHVLPRSMGLGSWAMLTLLLLKAQERLEQGRELIVAWPGLCMTVIAENTLPERSGKGCLTHPRSGVSESFTWTWQEGEANRPWSDVVQVRSLAKEGQDGPEIAFCAQDLAWNRKQLIVLAWLEQQADHWWENQQEFGTRALGHFLQWQEDQYGQNLADVWRAHLPGLAWAFVLGRQPLQAPFEFLSFLRKHWQPCPIFDAKLNAQILTLLDHSDWPNRPALAAIMDRIRALGVPVNLWALENRLWDLGLGRPEIRDLAGRLGVSVMNFA